MPNNLRDAALHYHREPHPGKIRIQAIKPLSNQRDLALAYSPGVAERLSVQASSFTVKNGPYFSSRISVICSVIVLMFFSSRMKCAQHEMLLGYARQHIKK